MVEGGSDEVDWSGVRSALKNDISTVRKYFNDEALKSRIRAEVVETLTADPAQKDLFSGLSDSDRKMLKTIVTLTGPVAN